MWTAAILSVLLATIIYSFIDASMVAIQPRTDEAPFTTLFLVPFYLDAVTLAAWSSLYFAINYYLRVEQQSDQLARLESQATASTLAMLRYQINPHFLFNTLNSISTLVLLKQTEPANAMLSRLSAFLRYTLVNEPSAEVTLAQEVDTLRLYLDIEKMRFEERLRVRFDVDPRVSEARLPSLLLQPIIENAIKYAVTPSEEGADIILTAHLVGQNVRITVSDSGGGLNPDMSVTTTSTGVGLANIRDRLSQAYGDRHRFETRNAPGGGFTVTIEIPFIVARPPADPTADQAKATVTA
jgi:LytS/YehU family sensor histidine kinase